MSKVAPTPPVPPVLSLDAARDILKSRGLIGSVTPSQLLASAREMQLGLSETLDYLAKLLDGGQGEGPFPETVEALKAGAR